VSRLPTDAVSVHTADAGPATTGAPRVLRGGAFNNIDDCVLFSDEPNALCEARDRMADWLMRERGLQLKDPLVEPLDNRRPAIFLGFRVSRAGLGPGPKALRRLRRRLRRADDLEPDQLARSLLAFRGLWRALGG
jgi:hypothetical protein